MGEPRHKWEHRWENNIARNHKEIGYEDLNWM
jgi:hypothetical protein